MLARENTQTYYESLYIAAVKRFITLAPNAKACLRVATGHRVVTTVRFDDIIGQHRA
jgi:hypothetical protein